MKSEVNPAIVAVVIVALVVVVGGLIYFKGGQVSHTKEKPPGMPADVAAEFQKRMGTSTPTGSPNSPGAPSSKPMGGMMMPPMSPNPNRQ